MTIEPQLADSFRDQINDDLATIHIDPLRVGVELDADAARAGIAELAAQTITIAVDVGLAVAAARLDTFVATPRRINVGLNIDPVATSTTLEWLTTDRLVRIGVEVNPDDILAAETLLNHTARNRSVSFGGSLDEAAFAALEARLDHLARNRRVDIDVNGVGGVASRAEGATRSLTAMSLVKFTGVVAGIGAIGAAIGGLVGLAGGAVAVLGAIGGVAVLGSAGLGGAFKARSAATDSAGADAEASAQARKSATDAVTDAQYALTEANRNAEQAQQRLNDSYRDAARGLRDINAQLKDAELSQEGAALAVARARERLAQVNANPKASSLDRQEADLGLRTAQQRYEESKTKTADLRVDVADANDKGIQGAAPVVAAKQGVTDAQHQAETAARQLADAQLALAEAGKQAGAGQDALDKALAKLSPNARDFYEHIVALGPAWSELRAAVSNQMFDQLGASFSDLANHQMPAFKEGMVGIAGALNTALRDTFGSLDSMFSGLVANGTMQQFVAGVSGALSGMAPMVTALSQGFIQMGAVVGPTLGPLFTSLAGVIATVSPALAQLGAVFSESLTAIMPTLGEFINAMAINLAPILPIIGGLLNQLGQALIPLMPALSQIAQIVGTALAETFQALAPALPPIASAFTEIVRALAPIMPVIGQLIGSLVQALAPAIQKIALALAPVIKQFAEALVPIIEKLQPVLSQVAGVIADILVQAMEALLPAMVQMAPLWMALLEAILPLIPPILQLVMQAIPPLINIFESLIPVMAVVIKILTDVANAIVPILIPAINTLSEIVAKHFSQIAERVTWAVNEIVLPTLTTIENFIKNTLAPALTWMYEDVAKPVFEGIANTVKIAWDNTLKPSFDALTTGLEGIKTVFTTVGETVRDVWDGIVGKIKWAVGSIGGLLAKIPASAPIPGAETMHNLGVSMTEFANRARGGPIAGPGGPTDDLIPIMASNGEYVINAAATAQHAPLLEAINSGALPGFASGGPVNAVQFAKDHPNVPYEWGGESVSGADCSGWVGLLQQVSTGVAAPTARLGTTEDVMSGRWPQLLPGASKTDAFVIGSNMTHMAATILGTNVEARQPGERVRIGDAAAGAWASQFTTIMHVDPAVFRPAYIAQESPAPSTGAQQSDLDDMTDVQAAQPLPSTTSPATGSPATQAAASSWSGLASKAASDAVAAALNEPADSKAPQWGSVAGAFVGGMLGDVLSVFGVPDSLPSWAAAGQQFLIDNPDVLDAEARRRKQEDANRARFAAGGSVWGPGGPTDDRIPAWLSNGEFVMNSASAHANRPLLEAMNADGSALGNLMAPVASAAPVAAAVAAGNRTRVDNSMEINLSTPDVDTAYQKAKTWQAQRALTYTGRWS
ncbi:hypothetical protein ACIBCN_18860 [Nocardia sp. NPDC051052]|uniref:hypothetical protein n=1 Tax=Nocardia sp. NPDC051052 TaxID=3364322 RepID=UPI0037AF42EE